MLHHDPDLGLKAIVVGVNSNHAIKQGILRPVNSGIFDGVAGEDSLEIRMDPDVSILAELGGKLKNPLLKDGKQNVI